MRRIRDGGVWYLFLAPSFLLFLVFNLLVWIFLFVLSFTDWSLLGDAKWVGIENYTRLGQDEVMIKALTNTVLYVLMYVAPLAALSLGLALLVNRAMAGMYFFRASFFLPVGYLDICAGYNLELVANPEAQRSAELLPRYGGHTANGLVDKSATCAAGTDGDESLEHRRIFHVALAGRFTVDTAFAVRGCSH